jgi:hypothetical protein
MIIFCSKSICHVGVIEKGHCTIMHFLGLIARAGWEIRENVEGRVVGVSLLALVTASGLSESVGGWGANSPPPQKKRKITIAMCK